MSKKCKLSFAIPIIRPLHFDKALITLQDALITDISSWGGSLPFNNEYFLSGSKLVISLYKNPTEYIPFKKYFKPHQARNYYLLVFRVDAELC